MLNLEQIVRSLACKCLFVLLMSNLAFSQELKVLTKVTDDSVAIKWLPSDYFALRALRHGASVYRVETKSADGLSTLNYAAGKEWTIQPLEDRYNTLNPDDTSDAKMLALLEPAMFLLPEDQQNFAFGTSVIENVSAPKLQYLLGNVIVDKDFSRPKKYAYKIEVEGLPPAYLFIDPSQKTTYSSIGLKLDLDQKKTVVCSWDMLPIRSETFAFDIEHSVQEPREGDFLTAIPYLPFTSEFETRTDARYRHNTPVEGEYNFYRVTGRDAFGMPALYSEWEKIYVPERIYAYVQIDSVVPNGFQREVYIHTIPLKKNTQVETLQLYRSNNRSEDYELLQSIPYTDTMVVTTVEGEKRTGDHFYYIAKLLGKDDTVSSLPFYFFTLDQEPPEPPIDLTITIDSNGITQINWTPPLDSDIKGYRVFRGNQKSEEFVERTTQLDTVPSFVDTLRLDNLTSQIYYFVRTVDLNFNNSTNSDTIMGLKPDTIAPVPCVLVSVEITEDGLLVCWIDSDSKDAESTELLKNGQPLGSFAHEYLDTNLVFGKTYTYQLQTRDRSGNKSTSNQMSQLYEPGYRPAMITEGSINLENKSIDLSWEPPSEPLFSIQIYRAVNNGRPRYWKTVSDTTLTKVSDRNVRLGETYTYSLKYVTADGIHSLPSEIKLVY